MKISQELIQILNDMGLDYIEEEEILRTREFFPRQYEFGGVIKEIVDRMYCKGHIDGFERGAYESETREDV